MAKILRRNVPALKNMSLSNNIFNNYHIQFCRKNVLSPLFVQVLIKDWLQLPLGKQEIKLWWAVPLWLLWEIWKERNNIVFQDAIFSYDRLKSSFFKSLYPWMCVYFGLDLSLVRCLFFSLVGKFLFWPMFLFLWLLFGLCVCPIYFCFNIL